MRKKRTSDSMKTSTIMDNSFAILVVAIMGICMGLFFIFSQNANKPIPREEAVMYVGTFDRYRSSKNYCEIYLTDGTCCEVYPHTESREFREEMESLEKGTKLYILVNPNNQCVVEVKTETKEILNFEASQQAIDSYDNGYIVIGIIVCVSGAFLIVYVIGAVWYKRKEATRHTAQMDKGAINSGAIRRANPLEKGKTLLQVRVKGYEICYRRVRSVNELMVNGWVYDEKKGLIEFEHRLCATVDGYAVEAGYDADGRSYIMFDGKVIERKVRWI